MSQVVYPPKSHCCQCPQLCTNPPHLNSVSQFQVLVERPRGCTSLENVAEKIHRQAFDIFTEGACYLLVARCHFIPSIAASAYGTCSLGFATRKLPTTIEICWSCVVRIENSTIGCWTHPQHRKDSRKPSRSTWRGKLLQLQHGRGFRCTKCWLLAKVTPSRPLRQNLGLRGVIEGPHITPNR